VPDLVQNSDQSEMVRVRNLLVPYFGKKPLWAITTREIEMYLAKRKSGEVSGQKPGPLKQASVNRELCRLKNMLSKAVDWNYLERNPAERIRQKPEPIQDPDYLSVQEFQALVDVCEEPLRSAVVLAVHTGARRGELLNLKWSDVDLEHRLVTFRKTKNGETRHVPLSASAFETFEAHRRREALSSGKISKDVFVNGSTGKPFRNFRRGFASAVKRAGITRRFTWHQLRHTAGSQMTMSGWHARAVGEVLGHKTPKMTQRCARLSHGPGEPTG
jgi:integrase